ncbi:MAG: DUF1707 domain-containing protein [Solirubrobacterales bacterium]|nr:DUF1707 domain-containing protein [Solirubrobacterales bacterium]
MPDTPDADLRVSDQQRERAAREIREHFAAGRLTDEELGDRLQAAYSARTERELKSLLADLPKLPATRAEQKAEIAERRRHLERRLVQEAGGGAALFLFCTVIWLVSGANGQFWPIWVALLALIPLLRNGWRLYGPAPELDRVERDLDSRRRRDEQRNRYRDEVRGEALADRTAGHRRRRDR